MIDFHSHILPGIDDGAKNLEQSIAMVNEAKKVGFTKIISTSHYMENYYECNEKNRKELLEQVQKNVNGIELCLGNEIYITNNIIAIIFNVDTDIFNKIDDNIGLTIYITKHPNIPNGIIASAQILQFILYFLIV